MSNKLFKENFDKASVCYQLGQYDQSIYYWQQALKQEPENIHVLSLIALVNQNFFGKLTEAKHNYQRILELDPNNLDALESLAILYYDHDQVDLAYPLFLRVLELDTQKTEVYLYLGAIALQRNQKEKALAFYQHVIHRYPKHHQALLAMADIYATFDLAKAESFYTYILNFNPEDANTMIRLAKLSLEQNNPTEAEIWLKKAITTDDKSLEAVIELGKLLSKNPFRQLDAEYWLHKAYHLDAHNLYNNLAMAQFYRQNHYDEEAEFYYKEVLQDDPDNLEALYLLADLLLDQDRLTEAEEILDHANELYSHHVEVQRLLARLADILHQPDEAEEHLLYALASDPDNLITLEKLARFYLNQHRNQEAEHYLHKILLINPQHQASLQLLQIIQLEQSEQEDSPRWQAEHNHVKKPQQRL